MYNALDVANYIVNKCNDYNISISNLKLQKLLYFAWVNYYKETNKYLFNDSICAWQFGPVVPKVYYKYSLHGGRAIFNSSLEQKSVIEHGDEKIIDKVILNNARRSAFDLVEETHKKGTPWHFIYNGGMGNRSQIPFDLIKRQCENDEI